jgi:hypothetical protein
MSKNKEQLEQEIAELRRALEIQTSAAQTMGQRLSTVMPNHRLAGSELMVGVRNISDTTIALPKEFDTDPDLSLHADVGRDDPNSVTVVSLGHWRKLRKSRLMELGMIMRDDSLVDGGMVAPADADRDIPTSWAVNAIPDPVAWIEDRTEQEIKVDIEKMTSLDSLRRLRRVVDDKLRQLQAGHPDKGRVSSAVRALRELPAKLQLVDNLTTNLLEMGDGTEEKLALGQSDLSALEFPRGRFRQL